MEIIKCLKVTIHSGVYVRRVREREAASATHGHILYISSDNNNDKTDSVGQVNNGIQIEWKMSYTPKHTPKLIICACFCLIILDITGANLFHAFNILDSFHVVRTCEQTNFDFIILLLLFFFLSFFLLSSAYMICECFISTVSSIDSCAYVVLFAL